MLQEGTPTPARSHVTLEPVVSTKRGVAGGCGGCRDPPPHACLRLVLPGMWAERSFLCFGSTIQLYPSITRCGHLPISWQLFPPLRPLRVVLDPQSATSRLSLCHHRHVHSAHGGVCTPRFQRSVPQTCCFCLSVLPIAPLLCRCVAVQFNSNKHHNDVEMKTHLNCVIAETFHEYRHRRQPHARIRSNKCESAARAHLW